MNTSSNTLLHFDYLDLDKILKKFYDDGVDNIDVTLIISLEKDYYMSENMKLIMSDLKKLTKNKEIVWNIDGKLEKFKIRTLRFDVGDVLNRHMFYYRHCADYFDKHNIDQEELIPLEIRKDFEEKSYIEGKEEGKDWFKDNIDAFNLFSNEKVLTKDYYIGDDITTIFEETEDTPKLEYICYEHWLKQSKYYQIIDIINNLMQMDNSVIDRCYNHEANHFYERLERINETPKYKELFIKQSKKYLIDETPATALSSVLVDNVKHKTISLYYGGKIPNHFTVYNGKEARKNSIISDLIKVGNPLYIVANFYHVIIDNKK